MEWRLDLSELTKKNTFRWSNSIENAFQLLKQALTTLLVQLPNFTQPFVVECEACLKGIGAILLRDDHPITYFTNRLSFSSRLKYTYDHKLLTLVLALHNGNTTSWAIIFMSRSLQLQISPFPAYYH